MPEPGSVHFDNAFTIGKILAENGYTICNGGYGGVMLASSMGAKKGGDETIGVILDKFSPTANEYTDTVIKTSTIFARLEKLISLSSAYILLPGGTGTLLELAASWELINKHLIQLKPIILYKDFWSAVIKTIYKELFPSDILELKKDRSFSHYKFLYQANTPAEIIEILKQNGI